jgi:hypothetical protein
MFMMTLSFLFCVSWFATSIAPKGFHAAFAAAPIDVRNIRSELFTGKIFSRAHPQSGLTPSHVRSNTVEVHP